MFRVYRKLFSLLDSRERRHAGLALMIMVLVAVGDALGVASIMPFIALLSDPAVISSNQHLAAAYEGIGFQSERNFVFFVGLLVFIVLVSSLGLRALGIWSQWHFSQMRSHAWSLRLMAGYLRQPYEWFLSRHSAELGGSALVQVERVVNMSLFPALRAVAQALVVALLLSLLIAVDPRLAAVVAAVFFGAYAPIFLFFRGRLVRLGSDLRSTTQQRFRIVQEAFGGIKEIQAAGLAKGFVDRFDTTSFRLARHLVEVGLLTHLPNVAIQVVLFGGMLLILLYLMNDYGSFQKALPILALYALAAYRLTPALQGLYHEIAQVRTSEAALDALAEDLDSVSDHRRPWPVNSGHVRKLLALGADLRLRAVSYSYPGAQRAALNEVSMSFPTRSSVAIVGSTGSGKTTAVDVVLGLLRPSEGAVYVGDREITDVDILDLQQCIGYVPQQIFLVDDSIAANIAFGTEPEALDYRRVEDAARVASLHDFVVSDLPQGYKTFVGERGVRLSGGQRQRIGIARALYRNPDILVFDEATSALDNLTEHEVTSAIKRLASSKTVIMVAHRLSTVRHCDRIYVMEGGTVSGSGTFEELAARNPHFRAMVSSASS